MARTTVASLEEGTEKAVQLVVQIICKTAATGKITVFCSSQREQHSETPTKHAISIGGI